MTPDPTPVAGKPERSGATPSIIEIFSTKHCLSSGIEKLNGEIIERYPYMFRYQKGGFSQYLHREGVEWHRNMDAAIRRANVVKAKKIASLQKQIAALEKLTFE